MVNILEDSQTFFFGKSTWQSYLPRTGITNCCDIEQFDIKIFWYFPADLSFVPTDFHPINTSDNRTNWPGNIIFGVLALCLVWYKLVPVPYMTQTLYWQYFDQLSNSWNIVSVLGVGVSRESAVVYMLYQPYLN